MAYMICAKYFKSIEKKSLVLSLTSPLSKAFKADVLFRKLFDKIYIDYTPKELLTNIFDPDSVKGLWHITPLLYQKYGRKILPKVDMKKSLCNEIFTKKKNYIVFNPLVSAGYNVARNMDEKFINIFANKLYEKFGKKLIVLTDKDNLIKHSDIKIVRTDNLYDIFYLISKARVFIGGDTGFSHFAGLARVKYIFTLYGTKYPAVHNGIYFNANVMYDDKKTLLYNYILDNNSLDKKDIKNIIKKIKRGIK